MAIATFPPKFKGSSEASRLIRQLRRAEEISQLCLAYRVGCSETTIRNLERGRTAFEAIFPVYRKTLIALYADLKKYSSRQT